MNSPKSNTPLLSKNKNSFNLYLQSGDEGKHVEKMKREFSYLDAHLKKLSQKSEVERFKYYAKKRISFYYRLLKSHSARSNFSKSAMSLINKIAKRLDSTVTKITKLFQKSDTDIKKYLQRSHVSRNYDKNSKGVRLPKDHENKFLIDESSLKKRTLIHLKRYLAKIPPTNIEEFKAFKNLFKNRAEADMFENNNQNVQNIKNTLAFRINKKSSYTANSRKTVETQFLKRMHMDAIDAKKIDAQNEWLKTRAKNEANRHLRIVAAGNKLKPKLVSTAQKIAARKKELEEAGQRLEEHYRKTLLKRVAKEAKEKVQRNRKQRASLRWESMVKKGLTKHRTNKIRSLQRQERQEIEERLKQLANHENQVTRSIERRREAQRIGLEKQKKREETEMQRAQKEKENVRQKWLADETTKNTNPEVLKKVMAEEVAKALAGSSQRPPSVKQHKMQWDAPSSATASIIFVSPRSNGRHVNTPGFNAKRITNNKRQIVVRPEEETWANTFKMLRNDAYYMFAPFAVRK